MQSITLRAPAKLNLALEVCGVRSDGYHIVDMLMQTVSIYERVEISRSRGYSLRCPGSRVPCDGRNIATKAARAFFWHTGLLAGCDIVLHKTVPTRAGLAGGSADAAAVLVGLNELYGARLSLDELCAIGLELGADVPFSLRGGTARVRGIGEQITPLPALPGCWFVVAMPQGVGVATPAAYARYDELGSPAHPDVDAAEAAIRRGDLAALLPHMQNALEHANGGDGARVLRAELDGAGAAASMMTGSGAAVFGLFWERAAAEAAAAAVQKLAKQVFTAQPVAGGPQVCSGAR